MILNLPVVNCFLLQFSTLFHCMKTNIFDLAYSHLPLNEIIHSKWSNSMN
uniref:Uncharacterized protein n=1 Tax=Anguilla anguilla TaxID=7936 RepID=A0A0E9SXA2_ANGAN